VKHSSLSPSRSASGRSRPAVALASLLALVALFALGAASATAAPPTVTTEAPEAKIPKAVALKGIVNPNGLATKYIWQYGTTTSYGSTFPLSELAAGEGTEAVKVFHGPLSILEDTVYHVRLVATNKDGTSYGEDKAFKSLETSPTWKLQTTPNISSRLNDVSCVTGGECFAVGDNAAASPTQLAARWNGTEWKTQVPAAEVPGPSSLASVSCTSASFCMAVGYRTIGFNKYLLAERWDGTAWKTVELGISTTFGAFTTVSCASSTQCMATGGTPMLWNGTEWKPQYLPASAVEVVTDVSCPTTSFCMAVGKASSGSMYTYTWNGSKWTQQVASGASSWLEGVSCSSASACSAVGYTYTSTALVPKAGRWNGTAWSFESLPSTKEFSWFNGVSCPKATVCYATGIYYEGVSTVRTLVERWNGISWEVQSSPNPAGSTESALFDVSCISASVCGSVGSAKIGGVTKMLAEQAS
jgi:hypothetical protein